MDIRGEQYGQGAAKKDYTGIFPVVTTAPIALYYQGKLENTPDMDVVMAMMDATDGIEMNTWWYKHADPLDDETKEVQAEIVASIEQELNFNTSRNRFHRGDSLSDSCAKMFPGIGVTAPGML